MGVEITSGGPVTVGTTYTRIVDVDVDDAREAGVTIKNTGGTPFSGFRILTKDHEDAGWHILFETAGAFTTPEEPLLRASSSIFTLAGSGAEATLGLWCGNMKRFALDAVVASGTTTATALGTKK